MYMCVSVSVSVGQLSIRCVVGLQQSDGWRGGDGWRDRERTNGGGEEQ